MTLYTKGVGAGYESKINIFGTLSLEKLSKLIKNELQYIDEIRYSIVKQHFN